jgi:hypothetical protein
MAASQLDKARKSYSFLQKTLSGQVSDTDTTFVLNNVTNIPTDTGVSFVVDRVDSAGNKTPTKRELCTGRVSGGSIVNVLRGEQGTTPQTHANNAVIEFVNSGEMWNDLIDAFLQDHSNPNGNHKNLTDDNSNEWIERGSVASAVNQVKVTNAITGSGPRVDASGDDTNVDLNIGAKGSGIPHIENSEIFSVNFVASGGVVAISSGLIGTFSNIVYYINGKRYKKSSVPNKTYTASKDTYVDIDNTGAVTYTEVLNNATSPALAANSIRLAIVVTNASAISLITQGGFDSLGNRVYYTSAIPSKQPGIWWEEIARGTLASNGSLMTLPFIPGRKYLKVIVYTLAAGGTIQPVLRFNNDSAGNYAIRIGSNGSADGTAVSQPNIAYASPTASTYPIYAELDISNFTAQEKIVRFETLAPNAPGGGNTVVREEGVGKWANSASQISRIDIVLNSGTGTFAAGSEIIVMGHD